MNFQIGLKDGAMQLKIKDEKNICSCISVVVDDADFFLQKHVQSRTLLSLYQQRLKIFADQAEKQGFAPCIDVPYFLCLGLSQDNEKSRRLALLSTLVFLGCDLLDDFHDGDLHVVPNTSSVAQVTLASSVLLSALPALVASEFFGKESSVVCQSVARSLLVMAQGQEQDVLSRFNPDFSIEDVEEIVRAKSGEEVALFSRLVAQVLNQSVEKEEACAEFGRHLGVALQIASDVSDIFEAPLSQDLRQGTLTIPLALYLLRLTQEERELFCKQWRQGSQNTTTHEWVRDTLEKSGALAHTAFLIESHCGKAAVILKELQLDADSLAYLENLMKKVSDYSVFHLEKFFKIPSRKNKMAGVLMGA